MSEARAHWNNVYGARPSNEFSWFQQDPTTSVRLVRQLATRDSSIIDVGAGASRFVDVMVELGYRDLSVLDVSDQALDEVRARLATGSEKVTFIVGDVTEWVGPRQYQVWHDRAVFHFMTDEEKRDKYLANMERVIAPGDHAVLAVFAEDGPQQCSGLPVCRYSVDELMIVMSPLFALETCEREIHLTPGGATQPMNWVVLRRLA